MYTPNVFLEHKITLNPDICVHSEGVSELCTVPDNPVVPGMDGCLIAEKFELGFKAGGSVEPGGLRLSSA